MLDPHGRVRPVWRQFVEYLARLSPDEIDRRCARGDQYLRDAGVFFRQYGAAGSTERPWPLAHVPVIIEEAEWTRIADGLIQRADLLEAVAADLYGQNRLVAEGHLPAELVAGSREWLRPLVGIAPRGGHFLHFVAFEIGRGPDGAWWVLGDRTQAPSGAGFALENRVATTRVHSDLFGEARIERLAGFFRSFRDALQTLSADPGARTAILTPGPLNDTHFEHAYIARYLGFTLLEGDDLTIDAGRVMVRTVAGLRPVNVLWRRLDANFADPLELAAESRIGTPGLVGAVRRGTVTLVNALGSGVLETRALLAFLPRIAPVILGEPLRLPNIATWWCGGAAERAHVRAAIDRMMIGSAFATHLPFETIETTVHGGQFRGAARMNVEAWLEAEGPRLVGQEVVTLSTTPARVDGVLAPRPMSLRVFLARTEGGWQVMPGGFARIGRTPDPSAIAMQRGGSAADVWIVSEKPVEPVSMLPRRGAVPFARATPAALPSRAADNLYWLGRYVERAEGAMRLLRALHVRVAEASDPEAPLALAVADELEAMGVDAAQNVPAGLQDILRSAISSAGNVRDRFSIDGWMALNDLARTAARMEETVAPGDDAARAMGVLLRKITGFSGLVHENMYRFTGWRFLTVGRSLERALHTVANLRALADPGAPDGALDLAVEVGDSVMTHRRRYAVSTNRETVVDLLVLDAMNPRSVLYQLTEVKQHVATLPGAEVNGQLSALSRAVLRTQSGLAVLTPEELDGFRLGEVAGEIGAISDLLSDAYMR
ncbi:circularly permuted type 2 ATP-grasp protein [Amaricoccus sp.]|uniref:circularly permuted type 2 ATP-grasp protein n=1 Tax=Amaricoccus sp. TaxID=1872485 RepID=UPI001B7496B5|nr:circularly permuted type 2 ATP-grasp protein [Amaricoccus sp.]MBP7242044.1 circularly permuted type 2 ATP-grasp protein [Amaricoccus sp.]